MQFQYNRFYLRLPPWLGKNFVKYQLVRHQNLQEEMLAKDPSALLERSQTEVIDSNGVQCLKCHYCEAVGNANTFFSRGHGAFINHGICRDCWGRGHKYIRWNYSSLNYTLYQQHSPPNKPEAQTAFSVCAPGFAAWIGVHKNVQKFMSDFAAKSKKYTVWMNF